MSKLYSVCIDLQVRAWDAATAEAVVSDLLVRIREQLAIPEIVDADFRDSPSGETIEIDN